MLLEDSGIRKSESNGKKMRGRSPLSKEGFGDTQEGALVDACPAHALHKNTKARIEN
jgi:hypothetical protein